MFGKIPILPISFTTTLGCVQAEKEDTGEQNSETEQTDVNGEWSLVHSELDCYYSYGLAYGAYCFQFVEFELLLVDMEIQSSSAILSMTYAQGGTHYEDWTGLYDLDIIDFFAEGANYNIVLSSFDDTNILLNCTLSNAKLECSGSFIPKDEDDYDMMGWTFQATLEK